MYGFPIKPYLLCTVSLLCLIMPGFPIMPDYARFPYYVCQVTASMLAAVRRAGGRGREADAVRATLAAAPLTPKVVACLRLSPVQAVALSPPVSRPSTHRLSPLLLRYSRYRS